MKPSKALPVLAACALAMQSGTSRAADPGCVRACGLKLRSDINSCNRSGMSRLRRCGLPASVLECVIEHALEPASLPACAIPRSPGLACTEKVVEDANSCKEDALKEQQNCVKACR